jgi:hypothetical protein
MPPRLHLRVRKEAAHETSPWRVRSLGDFVEQLSYGRLAERGLRWTKQARALASRHAGSVRQQAFAERVWLQGARVQRRGDTILHWRPQIYLNFSPMIFAAAAASPWASSGWQQGKTVPVGRRESGCALPFPLIFAPSRGVEGANRMASNAHCGLMDAVPLFEPQRLIAPTLDRVDLMLKRTFARNGVRRRMEQLEGESAASLVLSRRIARAAERREVPQFVAPQFLARPVMRSTPQRTEHEEQEVAATRDVVGVPRPAIGGTGLPANMAQITDHVINQLDRRMLAWRERMGKV